MGIHRLQYRDLYSLRKNIGQLVFTTALVTVFFDLAWFVSDPDDTCFDGSSHVLIISRSLIRVAFELDMRYDASATSNVVS